MVGPWGGQGAIFFCISTIQWILAENSPQFVHQPDIPVFFRFTAKNQWSHTDTRLGSLQVGTRTPDGRARGGAKGQNEYFSRLNPKFGLLSLIILKLVGVGGLISRAGFQNMFINISFSFKFEVC